MSCTVRLKAILVLSLLLCLSGSAAQAQPAFQVKDLNTTWSEGIGPDYDLTSPNYNFIALGGDAYFGASDGIHGFELWRTDGTEAGTRLVADICPGSCASNPLSLTVVDGKVFFLADDGLHGQELWRSDGTPAGTVLIKDLIPQGEYGRLHTLNELNGLLVFSLRSYGYSTGNTDRRELWRSDGTAQGTFLLANLDIAEGYFFLAPEPPARLGGKLFFTATDGAHGREYWTTDGTAAGTVLLKDIAPGSSHGAPDPYTRKKMAMAGGRMFFTANGPEGWELWASDGTTAGTALVKDIVPGPEGSGVRDLTALGGEVFFFASDGLVSGLWKSDGTAGGTQPVKAVPSNAGSPAMTGGRLFFFVECELWTSNGTGAGTVMVKEIRASSYCEQPSLVSKDGDDGALLFLADDGIHGKEPWKSDGTSAGTSLVADLYPGPRSYYWEFSGGLRLDGQWYFRAKGGEDVGVELWRTDGTPAGTQMLRINHQHSGLHMTALGGLFGSRAFFDLNGELLFPGDDGVIGAELWKSDGTGAGTSLVQDIQPGPHSSSPSEFTRVGGTLFFSSTHSAGAVVRTDGTQAGTHPIFYSWSSPDGGFAYLPKNLAALGNDLLFLGAWYSYGENLMKSDGSIEGTMPIQPAPEYVYSIVSLGDEVLFQGEVFQAGVNQLWKSDGTAAGTMPLPTVLPSDRLLLESSSVRDGVLFFAGTTPAAGEELWQSDGTEAGTHLVADTVPGPGSKRLGPFATAGPAVFFAAGGNELWKNSGGSTVLVRALPGSASPGIRSLTSVGSKVYFSHDDGVSGRELWGSDGTEAGTHLFKDILPGPGSSHPRQLHPQENILVFSASDGVHGFEPWRSDGTALGTRLLQDIAPGSLPSSPTEFTASGANLYFTANDGTTGFELWAFPRSALLATFADVQTDHWAWRFVESLVTSGITGGCAPGNFCPALPVTRGESAVFLVRASHGPAFVPPAATGTVFQDVPAGHWAGPWIEQLAADGITGGCGGGSFCPAAPLTRAEMAVLLLRSRYGNAFVPPPPTGTVFNDVPADHWVASWIERLASEGITAGCDGGSYCPAATVTRAEMAVLLTRMFGLPLP